MIFFSKLNKKEDNRIIIFFFNGIIYQQRYVYSLWVENLFDLIYQKRPHFLSVFSEPDINTSIS